MKIKQLMSRYNLKTRQSIYDWCKAASLELAADSRGHKYATPEQIAVLDDLKQHLDNGGTLKDYTPLSRVEIDTITDTITDIKIDTQTNDKLDTVQQSADSARVLSLTPELLGEMVQAIASHMQPKSPLWWQKELEAARVSGWLLTTADIKELIGVKPVCQAGHKTYKRGCWTFVKSGKIGSQTAWRVQKEAENDGYKV